MDYARYARQLFLPEVGEAGQQRLDAARVLIVGAGGLGSAAAMYLSGAGVGTVGIVDDDVVVVSNLHRQLLHGTSRVGERKALSAHARIAEINPHVRVDAHVLRLEASNAARLVREYDVVIDGSDNLPTRYALSDACVATGRPNVHGSAVRFEGQATVLSLAGGPCYRCLFPEPPEPEAIPGCDAAGVLPTVPGIIGTIQATEALKLLLGMPGSLSGRLLLFDARTMRFLEVEVARDASCPGCGAPPGASDGRESGRRDGTGNR